MACSGTDSAAMMASASARATWSAWSIVLPIFILSATERNSTPTGPGTFSLSGSGLATVIGGARYSGTVVVTSAAPDGSLTDVLTETYTAANGDTLTIECRQSAVPIGTTILKGTDQWTVTGGTGRFARATGSGTGTTFVYNLQTFVKVSSGTITL